MQKLHSQQGAVLIVSLIILLVLTLIGVSGAQSVIMGERMTFASRDAKVALEVAESMARQGEAVIDGLADTSGFGANGWMRTAGNGPDDLFASNTWTDTNTTERSVGMTGPDGTALTGRMYIEMSGLASDDSNASDVDRSTGNTGQEYDDIQVFKIVTRGVGIGGTERIIVTLYGRAM
ncbi:PilX N-terminal domain-containing pilus assembly protein [Microbulbifer sp. ALW1]|uniref:pilus assembly PilX family protein n=1 Tax=Microbulbifer sp. (strain ALW1) TaxID=1516059 RepID=UPI00135A0278|nr:PilX N-terminal domain-containing pilus assembly protein [Microbulbifer sp. ALW1]